MTTLDDKAEGSPDVDLARQSAPGAYRLLSRDLEAADDLTAEGEFPQFGEFLKVGRLTPEHEIPGEQFIECPSALAKQLVELGVEVDEDFRILSNRKVDGEWQYQVERLDEDDEDDEDD